MSRLSGMPRVKGAIMLAQASILKQDEDLRVPDTSHHLQLCSEGCCERQTVKEVAEHKAKLHV